MRRFRDLQRKLRRSSHFGRLRLAAIATGATPILASTSCSRAPSFNILGSFFPSWLLSGIVGIALTVVVRILFVRANFEKELSPLVLVYPCLAALFTFSIWLLLFG
jgi:hypothetical protein